MKTPLLPLVAFMIAIFAGCAKPASPAGPGDESAAGPTDDFVQIDSDTTPEERRYLEFGRLVVQELAARDYAAFHRRLSSHAKARMSPNQFSPAEDETVFKRNEEQAATDVGLPEFLELAATMEKARGRPAKPLDLHVFSTDADILAGRKREALDAVEILFAIGNMPQLAPPEIRRASLRAQIGVRLSEEQLAEAAKAYDTTAAELEKDPDFSPYLNLKLVLVEEAGELRVGYFEFLPPSMLD